MIKNQFKTVLLLGILTALLLWIGSFFGEGGLIIALVISLTINFDSYWFSDKIVLRIYKAQPASKKQFKNIHDRVEEISKKAKISKPKIYILPTENPNAFATGRNPKHSAIAVTQEIMNLLDEKELKGVLSYELSNIKNRNTLIQTIAVSIAGIISYITMIARFSAIFGGYGDDKNNSFAELLILAIVTPIIAMLIQLSISRSREYLADESGARLLEKSKLLADALEKLEKGNQIKPLKADSKSSTSSLFIINPFKKSGLVNLLSTHPSTENRIKKLRGFEF
jgi:heat shock protein HtpX